METGTDPFEQEHGPILDELVAFTHEPRPVIRAKMEETVYRTARLFNDREASPERFYEATDAYLYELASYENDRLRTSLAKVLGKAMKGRHVLEYGCGIGSFAFMLVREGLRVTACDISRINMEFLQFRISRRALEGQIQVLPPDDALEVARHYDIISCQHVLEHVEDPVALLRRFYRSLKPGGLFTGVAPFDLIDPIFPEHLPENAHLRLEDLCQEAGFVIRGTVPFGRLLDIDITLVQAAKPG